MHIYSHVAINLNRGEERKEPMKRQTRSLFIQRGQREKEEHGGSESEEGGSGKEG